ncbi:MAG: hypothetical protein IPL86_10605 [Flavobacteriales bacterium]|nr:hypothetical protein [Flavobacteriales bacterium]
MNAYLGQATVQVRFLYLATYDYYWALDNFDVSGTPQPGFSWTSVPPGFTSSVQNPTNVAVGVNTTYKVTVTAGGCTSTAQVAVNTVAPPNAGNNGTLTICEGSTVTAPDLFAALVGTPNGGGSSAQVVVSEQAQPNAGNNGTLTVCAGSTVTAPQLFAALVGTPSGGGSWSPALAGAGTYTYTVTAVAPCAVNATAQVVVSEQAPPHAGTNGSIIVCDGAAPFSMFTLLGGSPQTGGAWSGPSTVSGDTYAPSTMDPARTHTR